MTEAATSEPNVLAVLKVPKGSEMLANELRERILTGGYPEGTSLPAERALVVQTGLSRTTVREALRVLEVQGLVQIRSGRSGGAFVRRPGEGAMAKTVEHIILGHQIELRGLLETRAALEPYCAELAARNRSAEQLAALESAEEALAAVSGDVDRAVDASVDWHVAVARASGNELLSGVVAALERAIHDLNAATGAAPPLDKTTTEARASVVRAIGDQNESIAAQAMREYVEDLARPGPITF
jgi:GntR family transcriptional repressor for pyruvate dehydrogenase complex